MIVVVTRLGRAGSWRRERFPPRKSRAAREVAREEAETRYYSIWMNRHGLVIVLVAILCVSLLLSYSKAQIIPLAVEHGRLAIAVRHSDDSQKASVTNIQ